MESELPKMSKANEFGDCFEERGSMHVTAGPQVAVPERWLDGNFPGKWEQLCSLWEEVLVSLRKLVNIWSHDLSRSIHENFGQNGPISNFT